MRPDEVPQQSAPLFEGQRKAVYVLDENGRYRIAQSGGTEAEVTVTEQAVAWFAAQADDARERARRGETSPLEYHMYRQRMDVPTLAGAAGLWRWQVRRDLSPRRFARLGAAKLQRYAEALGITTAQLGSLD